MILPSPQLSECSCVFCTFFQTSAQKVNILRSLVRFSLQIAIDQYICATVLAAPRSSSRYSSPLNGFSQSHCSSVDDISSCAASYKCHSCCSISELKFEAWSWWITLGVPQIANCFIKASAKDINCQNSEVTQVSETWLWNLLKMACFVNIIRLCVSYQKWLLASIRRSLQMFWDSLCLC